MTYQKLFHLKYEEGLSTHELLKRYPKSANQVSKVALCDVPDDTLREIVTEEDEFLSLMKLKRKFAEILRGKSTS